MQSVGRSKHDAHENAQNSERHVFQKKRSAHTNRNASRRGNRRHDGNATKSRSRSAFNVWCGMRSVRRPGTSVRSARNSAWLATSKGCLPRCLVSRRVKRILPDRGGEVAHQTLLFKYLPVKRGEVGARTVLTRMLSLACIGLAVAADIAVLPSPVAILAAQT